MPSAVTPVRRAHDAGRQTDDAVARGAIRTRRRRPAGSVVARVATSARPLRRSDRARVACRHVPPASKPSEPVWSGAPARSARRGRSGPWRRRTTGPRASGRPAPPALRRRPARRGARNADEDEGAEDPGDDGGSTGSVHDVVHCSDSEPPKPRPMMLNHVALTVSDRERSAAFYGEHFGLTDRVHDDEHLLIVGAADRSLLALWEGVRLRSICRPGTTSASKWRTRMRFERPESDSEPPECPRRSGRGRLVRPRAGGRSRRLPGRALRVLGSKRSHPDPHDRVHDRLARSLRVVDPPEDHARPCPC